MFGLVVRFMCKDGSAATAFDTLVTPIVERIRGEEPGTLVFAVHRVEGRPLERILYELYRDKGAFEEHASKDYIEDFAAAREAYVSAAEVDWLDLVTGTGTGTGA
ncbi:antibiotic biosynthesis monooxygenase [Streptomyces sp. NPDC051172]|uniref:putative quinol monooxygenase n=1 Tax=Streptomyces sp. NPDC051172 TaxID=3155796 RepID=UPI00341617F9